MGRFVLVEHRLVKVREQYIPVIDDRFVNVLDGSRADVH
jgi:hypothetical protein